jgi:hypothetical protein
MFEFKSPTERKWCTNRPNDIVSQWNPLEPSVHMPA